MSLINDFAAISYGVLGLKSNELEPLQNLEPQKDAPIAIIGAGTALGEGFLIPKGNGDYQVFGTEGGHDCLKIPTSTDNPLLYVEKINQISVSFQWILRFFQQSKN